MAKEDAKGYRTQNPATGEVLQSYDQISDAELAKVLDSGQQAAAEWAATSVEERAQIAHKVGDLFIQKKEELGRIIAEEMGKPLEESVGEAEFSGEIFNYYAQNGPELLADQANEEAVIQRRPLGMLLGIMPWNYPYYQVARFVAPNLVTGNTIILKHAEICAHSARTIEEIFEEAGVPSDVFQVVFASHEQVSTIIEDKRVQGISLTGSERAGAIVAEQAGRNLKKVVLELGGSDPFVVLSSDDPRQIARDALAIRLENTGQACNSNKRLIVMEDIYDEFVDELVKGVKDLQPGDPQQLQEGEYSALSSYSARDTLLAQLDQLVADGARVLVGGKAPDAEGAYVAPAVLVDINREADSYYQELFGPVVSVYKVSSAEEALELANDTQFGLGSSVYSTDPEEALQVGEKLQAGMVGVNGQAPETAHSPFGGVKRSGYGRELGPLGIDEFVNKRLFYVNK